MICIADDVGIHRKTLKEHDHHIDLFLTRCHEKNTIEHYDGLQTDPKKIRTITDVQEPQNLEELRRFVGMVNYLSRFLPSVTREEQPRHNLLKKDVRWTLTDTQGESFQRINEVMV